MKELPKALQCVNIVWCLESEDQRPKNKDPFKTVLKSLEKGANMILD